MPAGGGHLSRGGGSPRRRGLLPARLMTLAGLAASFVLLPALPGCGGPSPSGHPAPPDWIESSRIFDHHVHVMSPALVARWKTLGIPFSKPDYAYSDADSILSLNPAGGMFLISMAYLYGSPEFPDDAEQTSVSAENDFVRGLAGRHPDRLFAFCSVNPLREYAADEIRRCRREGMYGLKLHFASSGISLRDPAHRARVVEFFETASQDSMPVVLHLDNQREEFGLADAEMLIDSVLLHPALLRAPPVELFLAHLGTSGGYSHKTRMILRRFIQAKADRPGLARHRIRFDLSAVGLTESTGQAPPLTPEDFADLSGQLTELGLERVVFGTDYPVFNTAAALSILESNTTLTREELTGIAQRR